MTFGVLASTAAAAANECATKAAYDRMTTGMSYKQVVSLLGCDGEEISSSEMAGHKTVMYMWVGSGVSSLSGANMNAMFQNDKLVSKAQFGLK
ncbi:MAG: hypothetical protein DI537_10235 [Stutzerimonas stutzeri]|nr:MAG: hypothetical protein DI537_10235 [Stutzerimonas stutzeri]